MGENKALDAKLKAMEARLNRRVDLKCRAYSGYWSIVFATIAFIIFSASYGRTIAETTLAFIDKAITYFG